MEPRSSLTIPGSIIIAAAIIAIALIYIFHPQKAVPVAVPQPGSVTQISMAPVTSSDHILGNPNAAIKIVEYSDPSCPFCKMFNPTMVEIMNEYGASGNVAWVYRDFPLDQPDEDGNILHPNAGHEAQAMECAAKVGGNSAFWKYEEDWYTSIAQDGAGMSQSDDAAFINQVASDAGLDAAAFSTCLSSGATKATVEKEYLDGINAGASGTPYSIIVTPSGSKIPLIGAQSYDSVKAAIETLLPSAQSQSQNQGSN